MTASLPEFPSSVSVSTGTILRFFLMGALLLTIYSLFDVILVILAAVVIASAIERVVRKLKTYKIHRVISVIGIYVLIALTLAGLLVFFVPTVVGEAATFLNNLPRTVSLQQLWAPLGDISIEGTGSTLGDRIVSISDLVKGMQTFFTGVDTASGAGAFQAASGIFGGVLSFILIIVLSFYLSVKEEGVDDFLRIVTPVKHHEYIIHLWKRSQRKIGLWLQGQVILGVIIGLLVYLVLLIVGVPHALLLALLAGFLEIIPIFGPILAAVPAIMLAFTNSGIGTALLVAGLYLVIQQFENQIFYPLVVKKVVGVSPIVVILALVIGAKLAGVLGALVAVPLAAAFMEYIADIEKYKKAEIAERMTVGK